LLTTIKNLTDVAMKRVALDKEPVGPVHPVLDTVLVYMVQVAFLYTAEY
jgi:hypothetical protein